MPSTHPTAALAGLSRMVVGVHAIRGRSDLDRRLGRRPTREITAPESLIHDPRQHAGPGPNGAKTPPTWLASSIAGGSDRPREQVAIETRLISDDRPGVWHVDAPKRSQTSLSEMPGTLILLGRQLQTNATAELGLPPGTPPGHATTEPLLAMNDATAPGCRSYRSAPYYRRNHDNAFVNQ